MLNIPQPQNASDGIPKSSADVNKLVLKGGENFTGDINMIRHTIKNVKNPFTASDAANKS